MFGNRIAYVILIAALGYVPFGELSAVTKHKKVELDVKQRKIKRNQKKKPGYSGRPSLSQAEIYASSLEKKLIKGIDKTIAYLKKTAKTLPKKSPERREMLERIMNLHLEQAVYVASEEHRVYNQAWDSWDAKGRKGKEPRLNNSKSRQHWQSVSAQSQLILRDFPKEKGADLANFNLAFSLLFLNKDKAAARAFTQLIQKYPNSPKAGDAYFSLGDYYFDRNNFQNAISNFKNALKYRRSKRYGWALFKLGWSYFNIGKYSTALNYWKKTVRHSRIEDTEGNSRLRDEALRDMVYAFAELRQVNPAITYYRVNGSQKHIGSVLTLLAQTFTDQGRFKQSISVWKKLQNIVPDSPEAPNAQKEVIALSFELGRFKSVWRELERFPGYYGPQSNWAKANDRKLVLETQLMIQDQMLYYAKLSHKTAQERGGSPRVYREAIKGYLLFLKSYPKSKAGMEVRFNLADIHFQLKDYAKAGRLYAEMTSASPKKAFMYDTSGKPTKNLHKEASLYMLDSYSKAYEPELKKISKIKPNFRKPPRQLSQNARNFITGCKRFISWYPKEKAAIKRCETFISEIHYRNNDKKNAQAAFWALATKYPGSKEGRKAVESLIPMYKGQDSELLAAANRLLKIPAYSKGKIGKKLLALRRDASTRAISKESDNLKRAKKYELQAKKYPKSSEADKLWFNAAVDYLKAGTVALAINAYSSLVRLYPKSSLNSEALLQLGKLYDARMSFVQAGQYYLLFGTKYPKSKEALASLLRACQLDVAVKPASALKSCNILAKRSPDDAKNLIDSLIRTAQRQGDVSTMTGLIRSHYIRKFKLSTNEKIIAWYRIYSANKSAEAKKRILGLARGGGVSGEALRYVGEMVFRDSDRGLAKFLSIKLRPGTVEALQKSIERKSIAIAALEKEYGKVLATKDSYWGIAAFHQLGIAYQQVGDMLGNPPAVKGAKKADVVKQLAPLAKEFHSKAKEFYNEGLKTASRFKVYNMWRAKLFNAKNRAENRKLIFEEWVIPRVDFLGSEVPFSVAKAVR